MGNPFLQRAREFISSPSHHRTISILAFLIIAASIPLTVLVAQQQQIFQQYAASVGPSGEAMPVGDLPGWKQIFTDDFTTDVPVGGFSNCVSSTSSCSGLPADVQAKWWAYPDGWLDTNRNGAPGTYGTYTPSKVISISGGVMNLNLHTENGVHMVSAPMPKLPGAVGNVGGLQYGRYAIRFKADPVPGYKTAWLLWPDSDTWPRDGEIDFPEGNLNGNIEAFMHWQNGTSGSSQDAYSTSSTYTSWHTAVTEWTPTSLTFYLDGQIIGTSTSRIPNTPMHWVIQTETSIGGPVPSDTASGNVQIDWAAAWAYAPGLVPSSTTPTPTPIVTPTQAPAPSSNKIAHTIVIAMENHDWSDIKGSGSAPYINSLLTRSDAVYASNYHQPTGLHPSEPNYVWLEAGTNSFSDNSFTNDNDPSASNSTSSTKHLSTFLNNAGLTWRSYQESKPSGCPISDSGSFATRHEPYVFFQDVSGNPPSNTTAGNCNNIVDYSQLTTDLANNTVANYSFITPNQCSDMHDLCPPTGNAILQGDNWLQTNLPTLLNSQAYKSGNTAIFIVWDEGQTLGGADTNSPIGMIMLSPKTKGSGYTNSTYYDHSSYVKTIQNIFNLSPYLGNANSATDLSDFFQPGVIPTGVTSAPTPTPTAIPGIPTPTSVVAIPTPTAIPGIPTPTPTRTPVTGTAIIAQDTFAGRTATNGWGTASDGNVWTLESGNSSLLSVGKNLASINGNSSSAVNYLTLGNQRANDAEGLLRFSTGSYNDNDARVILRFSDINNYYAAGIASPNGYPQLDIYKTQNGNKSVLSSIPFSATNNNYYWERIRVRTSGTTALIAVKVWQDKAIEPSTWNLIYTDSSPLPAGKVGINGWDGGVGWSVDNFAVTNLAITTITPSPTPTAIPTPNPLLSSGNGLLGMYYANRTLGGFPRYRKDSNINYNWWFGSPMSGIPNDNFSVRWAGYIVPQNSETYTFYANADDGVRVWVNGTLIINAWNDHSATTYAGSISLLANRKYTLRVEYYEHRGLASVNLQWSSPSTTKTIIPQSQFYTY